MLYQDETRRGAPRGLGGGRKKTQKKTTSKPPKTLSLHHLPLMWKSTNKHANSSEACAPTSVKGWGGRKKKGAVYERG